MTVRAPLSTAVVASVALLFASRAMGQAITDPTTPAPAPTPAPKPAADAPPSPFSFTGSYTADVLGDVSGGERTGVRYLDLAKLSAAFDGSAVGRDGLTGLISIEHHNGARFSGELVGDAQVVSNLEGPPEAFRLYEFWLQNEILAGRGGVKAGMIDLNTTFDVQETAALFLNSSDGTGPELSDTGLNGPSISPTTSAAVTAFYRPADGWTAQVGVFNAVAGDPDHRRSFVAVKLSADRGALLIAQVEKRFGDVARLEAGAWTYTADFRAIDDEATGPQRQLGGNAGLYGLAEGKLLAKPGAEDAGLSGWIRIGVANGDINPIANYIGSGLVYTGLIAGRDKDEIGVAINRAGFGDPIRLAEARAGRRIGEAETTLEATYRYTVRDWLNIQPDVQYVIHPGGDLALANALVVGVRFAFTASK
ncbi:MAG TPA: carbohydrate porin [Caulobacteraceae bacterium]